MVLTICDATEVSNGVYELNFHLEDGQGVWAYFYYQGNAYGNGADAPSDWGTNITVIDEYVDSSKETRESIRIEDMNEISLSKSYISK